VMMPRTIIYASEKFIASEKEHHTARDVGYSASAVRWVPREEMRASSLDLRPRSAACSSEVRGHRTCSSGQATHLANIDAEFRDPWHRARASPRTLCSISPAVGRDPARRWAISEAVSQRHGGFFSAARCRRSHPRRTAEPEARRLVSPLGAFLNRASDWTRRPWDARSATCPQRVMQSCKCDVSQRRRAHRATGTFRVTGPSWSSRMGGRRSRLDRTQFGSKARAGTRLGGAVRTITPTRSSESRSGAWHRAIACQGSRRAGKSTRC
jgi:hypothetical protein